MFFLKHGVVLVGVGAAADTVVTDEFQAAVHGVVLVGVGAAADTVVTDEFQAAVFHFAVLYYW